METIVFALGVFTSLVAIWTVTQFLTLKSRIRQHQAFIDLLKEEHKELKDELAAWRRGLRVAARPSC